MRVTTKECLNCCELFNTDAVTDSTAENATSTVTTDAGAQFDDFCSETCAQEYRASATVTVADTSRLGELLQPVALRSETLREVADALLNYTRK